MFVCIYVYMFFSIVISMCACRCVCRYIWIYVCMYLCIYVYTVFSIDSHVGMSNVDTDKNRLYIIIFQCYSNICLSPSLSHRHSGTLIKTMDIDALHMDINDINRS